MYLLLLAIWLHSIQGFANLEIRIIFMPSCFASVQTIMIKPVYYQDFFCSYETLFLLLTSEVM